MESDTSHPRQQKADKSDWETLRQSPTMKRMLDAMEAGEDIGHFGQFTFATVARHFLQEVDTVRLLAAQPNMDERKAAALLEHVTERGYNPPQRERILVQQTHNGFQLIPDPENPDSGNLYQEITFPDTIYDDISNYYRERAESR